MESNLKKPILIAHRGASGYYPEHTIPGYNLAIQLGADFIEPDLVLTKDGILVSHHYNYLSLTTNVSEISKFSSKLKYNAFFKREDWFINDFTFKELKTLKVRQAFPGRSKKHDYQYEIPSFEEILILRERACQSGLKIGVYPELKFPMYFESLGLNFEQPILKLLRKYTLDTKEMLVFIQSCDVDILKSLSTKTNVKLIMILDEGSSFDLGELSKFAFGIGPNKKLLFTEVGRDSGFVKMAHSFGLQVYPWTFRNDQLEKWFTSPEGEYKAFLELGINGLFSDFTDTARLAIDAQE